MKSLNKILYGLTISAMTAGVGVAIGANSSTKKAIDVKATDYEMVDTSASVVSMTAGYNGHEAPNEAYLVMNLSENDYAEASVQTFPYAGQGNFVAEDYNFLDKIYFSNDRVNWTPLSTAYADKNIFYLDNGSGIGGNVRFQLGALDGDYRGYLTRFLKVEEGCEFPSFGYIGTGQTGGAKKFVQKETVIFDSLYYDDDHSVRAYRDQFGVSEFTTIRELVTDPEHKWIWVRTTNNDYEGNDKKGSEAYYNTGAANASLYNCFSNIMINGTTPLRDVTDETIVFDRWTQSGMQFALGKSATSFEGVDSITIPALTQLPSWGFSVSGTGNKIYITENDLNLNYYVLGGSGDDQTSKADTSAFWYQAIETEVQKVHITNPGAHPFLGFTLSENDYGTGAYGNIFGADYTDPYDPAWCSKIRETIQRAFNKGNILVDGEPLELHLNNGTSLCEPYTNLGSVGSFSTRVKDDTQADADKVNNAQKIVIKKGTFFPSATACGNYFANGPTCFVAKEDTEFIINNYYNDGTFQKSLVSEEFAVSEKLTSFSTTMFRTDGTKYYFYAIPTEANAGYANFENNKTAPMDKYFGKLNFLNKLHFQFYDGTVIDGNAEGLFTELSFQRWTEKGIFLTVNPSVIPNDKIQYIESIRFDAGLEVPSFDRGTKYILENQITRIFSDGSKYDGHYAPWHLDEHGNRNYGQTSSLVKLGTTTLKPHFDDDKTILYLETPIYPDPTDPNERNKAIFYTAFFNLNFLGKIKLIKGSEETSLFNLPLADDIFANLYNRLYSNIGIRNLEDVYQYDAIKIEAGCEIPAVPNNAFEGTIEYYEIAETLTWYKNNQNTYGLPATITFGDDDVNAITGGTVENVPNVPTKDSDAEFDYSGYWKDADGNRFNPEHLVEGDEVYTADYDSSRVKYEVEYLDEKGEVIAELGESVENGATYSVAEVPAKTGYTGYWTSEDVTIDEEGKFTMPTKDVTLKAAYTANSYTLTCGDETVDVTFDSAIGELPAVPSVEGKHALGWYIGEEKLEETTVWTFAENKTAEAKSEDHSYEEWEDNKDGTHSSTCECGHKETENHSWDKGEVTTQPTHLAEGVKTFTCTKCGATKTEPVAKLTEHTFGDWEDNKDGETHSRECACGEVETEDHVWGEGVVTTKPTHTTEGEKTYTCTKCDATKTESIPVLTEHDYTDHYVDNENGLTHEAYCVCNEHVTEDHDWDDGEVTKPATCTENGVFTYTCEDCGAKQTEVIPATGHDWDEGEVTKPATCTENGVMTYTCECGETKTEVIPATGHDWDEGEVTKPATCTENGVMTYTCECGETKTEVIPATGHQLGELIAEVAATTEKEGMKAHYVCSVCGQYFDANKVACTKESLVIAKLPQPTPEPKKGCGGSVIAASAVVTCLAIAGAALIASKKKHD